MKEGGWGGKKWMGGRYGGWGGSGEDMGDWWWKKGGVSIFLDSSLVFSHIFD